MRLFLLATMLIASVMSLSAQEDDEILESRSVYTYHRADGNRFVEGSGTFPNLQAVDLPLAATPMWLVGTLNEGFDAPSVPIWAAILEDGSLQGTFPEESGEFSISPLIENLLPPGMPPVFTVNDFGAFLDTEFPADASLLTHPVHVGQNTVYVANNGNIVLLDDELAEITRLPLGALPDARIVLNAEGMAAIYVGATNERYVHGIMGDDLEGAALMILDPETGSVPTIIDLAGDEVFEGMSPIWADVDGDGVEDLITTVSSEANGAQIRVYRATDGSLMTSGPAIGQGGRWRHQLAWGAFGPNGENELVEVLTPHIGGVVGFYRYDGADTLNIVATLEGYTSHVIESRNLDMAVAGDFNGDGQPEIVIPNQTRTTLAGIRHASDDSAAVIWELPLDGTLITNLSAIQLENGQLALAAGVLGDDGESFLRVWSP
jgi:hypothetical protein